MLPMASLFAQYVPPPPSAGGGPAHSDLQQRVMAMYQDPTIS